MPKIAYAAASSSIQHEAHKHAAKMRRSIVRPHGNYPHSEFQFGTVKTIHDFATDGVAPSVDIYPDGSEQMSETQAVITEVKYLASYVPAVGDVVLVYRGYGRNRASRIVLGKVNGAPSPYPTPLGGFDSAGRHATNLLAVWGAASGTPASDLGNDGDWCATLDGHLWFKSAGTWTEKL